MNRTRKLMMTGLMTALTGVGAQIVIPIGTVPVTMQTFFVFLSGMVLGGSWGAVSQIAYLLLGALGIPVFSMFTSGMGILAGPTGGFLLAFPLCSFITGLSRMRHKYMGGFWALALLYSFGWLRLTIFTSDALKALLVGVVPFVGFDLLKVWGAVYVYARVKAVISLEQ